MILGELTPCCHQRFLFRFHFFISDNSQLFSHSYLPSVEFPFNQTSTMRAICGSKNLPNFSVKLNYKSIFISFDSLRVEIMVSFPHVDSHWRSRWIHTLHTYFCYFPIDNLWCDKKGKSSSCDCFHLVVNQNLYFDARLVCVITKRSDQIRQTWFPECFLIQWKIVSELIEVNWIKYLHFKPFLFAVVEWINLSISLPWMKLKHMNCERRFHSWINCCGWELWTFLKSQCQ